MLALATTLLAGVTPTDLTCTPSSAPPFAVPQKLQPMANTLPPVGSVAPSGWLLEQLLIQANSLAGYLSTSTFPGADRVNTSLWSNRSAVPKDSITLSLIHI